MNEISTAGVIVSYAFEDAEGVRPTEGYQRIPNIKSTPDANPEPSMLEATDLADTEWKRYIPSLKDPGGALGFNANNTDEFQAAWTTLCYFADIAYKSKLATWFCVNIPGLEKSFYFTALPSTIGVIGMDTDAIAEVTAYVSPNYVHGWDDVPGAPAAYIRGIVRKTITAASSPLDIIFSIEPEDAGIDVVTAITPGVVTVVKEDAKTITITHVSTGTTYILVKTDSDAGHEVGQTLFEIVSE